MKCVHCFHHNRRDLFEATCTNGNQTHSGVFPVHDDPIVLVVLIYVSYEVYIDDVLIHGRTPDEFLARIREAFDWFCKYNVNLSPSKSEIGMQ
jgi:hypothetical protein